MFGKEEVEFPSSTTLCSSESPQPGDAAGARRYIQGGPQTKIWDPVAGSWISGQGYLDKSRNVVATRWDQKNRRWVAVKIIPVCCKTDILCARKEFEIMKSLEHENILQVLDCVEPLMEPTETNPGEVLIVMPYFPDGSLLSQTKEFYQSHPSSSSLFSGEVLFKFFVSLLNALAWLAKKRVVHRDIKMANVLYSEQFKNVVLTDFDRSVICEEEKDTVESYGAHTRLYLRAPELFEGADFRYSHLSDMWALGCTMIEIATGKNPWTGEPPWEVSKIITSDKMVQLLSEAKQPPIPDQIKKNPMFEHVLQHCFEHRWSAEKALQTINSSSLSCSSPMQQQMDQDTSSLSSSIMSNSGNNALPCATASSQHLSRTATNNGKGEMLQPGGEANNRSSSSEPSRGCQIRQGRRSWPKFWLGVVSIVGIIVVAIVVRLLLNEYWRIALENEVKKKEFEFQRIQELTKIHYVQEYQRISELLNDTFRLYWPTTHLNERIDNSNFSTNTYPLLRILDTTLYRNNTFFIFLEAEAGMGKTLTVKNMAREQVFYPYIAVRVPLLELRDELDRLSFEGHHEHQCLRKNGENWVWYDKLVDPVLSTEKGSTKQKELLLKKSFLLDVSFNRGGSSWQKNTNLLARSTYCAFKKRLMRWPIIWILDGFDEISHQQHDRLQHYIDMFQSPQVSATTALIFSEKHKKCVPHQDGIPFDRILLTSRFARGNQVRLHLRTMMKSQLIARRFVMKPWNSADEADFVTAYVSARFDEKKNQFGLMTSDKMRSIILSYLRQPELQSWRGKPLIYHLISFLVMEQYKPSTAIAPAQESLSIDVLVGKILDLNWESENPPISFPHKKAAQNCAMQLAWTKFFQPGKALRFESICSSSITSTTATIQNIKQWMVKARWIDITAERIHFPHQTFSDYFLAARIFRQHSSLSLTLEAEHHNIWLLLACMVNTASKQGVVHLQQLTYGKLISSLRSRISAYQWSPEREMKKWRNPMFSMEQLRFIIRFMITLNQTDNLLVDVVSSVNLAHVHLKYQVVIFDAIASVGTPEMLESTYKHLFSDQQCLWYWESLTMPEQRTEDTVLGALDAAEQQLLWDRLLTIANEHGNEAMAEYLPREKGASVSLEAAAAGGLVSLLKTMMDRSCYWDETRALCAAVDSNAINSTKFLVKLHINQSSHTSYDTFALFETLSKNSMHHAAYRVLKRLPSLRLFPNNTQLKNLPVYQKSTIQDYVTILLSVVAGHVKKKAELIVKNLVLNWSANVNGTLVSASVGTQGAKQLSSHVPIVQACGNRRYDIVKFLMNQNASIWFGKSRFVSKFNDTEVLVETSCVGIAITRHDDQLFLILMASMEKKSCMETIVNVQYFINEPFQNFTLLGWAQHIGSHAALEFCKDVPNDIL